MSTLQIIIRLLLASLLGGLIGFEREKHGRVAGIKTHVLVTVGSSLIMMVSLYLYNIFLIYHSTHFASGVDPSRIASMIVAGIGFLGAGTIIKTKGNIWGLTTAACLWMAAAIGLAIGCGYYLPAIIATIISLSTLLILKKIGRMLKKDWYHCIEIFIDDRKKALEEIKSIIHNHGFTILKISYKKDIETRQTVYKIDFRARSDIDEQMIDNMANINGTKKIICN